MKIGSLFDGSGGFPLAASMCGIEPVWAAEIEPYPIAVTRSRFPNMKHLGSVTEVSGAEVEPVDIITFGSPCQDLSVAGKRAGLKHTENGDEETTRSGLFMEAIRIIKEMREATNGEYPRYAIWENVPGAFSSNKGLDFRVVLEEFVRISDPTAVMPEVPKAGWPYADVYCGDGWSLAYRVLDAQYWGVPQRRRRIYLVADFRGQRAGKVSFEREGMRGHFAESGSPREAVAGDAENCVGAADCGLIPYTLKIRGGVDVDSAGKAAGKGAPIQNNLSATLGVSQDQYLFQPIAVATQQGGAEVSENGICPTITAAAGMSGNNQPWIAMSAGFKAGQSMAGGIGWQDEYAATLAAQCSGTEPIVCIKTFDARGNGDGDIVNTITGDHENRITDYTSVVVYESHPMDSCIKELEDGISPTVAVKWHKGAADTPLVVEGAIPIHDQATRFSGKRGDNYDGKGNGLGVGEAGDSMNTLTGGDRHAVAYTMQGFGDYKDCGVASGLKARDYKDATDLVAEAPIALDRAFFNQGQNAQYEPQFYTDGTVPTLVAKGPGAVAVRYIVRRLTPTECARLQGFPDEWGHPDIKTELTDEEYAFWLNVRNTHAEINGKAVKEYTRDQMLTWYNKLHTDSAEYKLWGNGIALPCALYIMEGIADEPRN